MGLLVAEEVAEEVLVAYAVVVVVQGLLQLVEAALEQLAMVALELPQVGESSKGLQAKVVQELVQVMLPQVAKVALGQQAMAARELPQLGKALKGLPAKAVQDLVQVAEAAQELLRKAALEQLATVAQELPQVG